MPDYVVKMTFKGVDDTSKVFEAMERAAAKYGGSAKESIRGVGREADHASTALRNATKHGYSFAAIVKGILAANAIRGGIGYITGGVQKAATDFLQFGDVMTGAVARFREIDPRSAQFGQTVETMGKQVRRGMLTTRYSAVEGAQALNLLSMAGYNSQAALKMLPNLAGLATAAGEDFNEAVSSSSKILGGFGLRSDDVGKQVANHIRLNDQLAQSFLLATGDMHGMLETMKVIAPLSKEIHATQEETLALGVALSNAGIDGTDAATAIKRGFLNIFMTSKKMQDEFNLNGVFPYDLKTGQPRKYISVLGEVHKALSKLTPQQRNPILRQIFGVYGLAGQLKLMQEMSKIAEYEERIKKSRGTVDSISAAANSSPFAKLVMLGNTAMEKAFQVLDQYSGKAKGGFEWLTKKIENFDARPLIDGLNLTGKAIYGVYRVVEPFLPYLPQMAEGWLLAKGAMLGFRGVLLGLKVAEWSVKFATFAVDVHKILGAGNAAKMGLMGLANGFEALYVALLPFAGISAVLTTVTALLIAAKATSDALHNNGFGDNRTADDLIRERNAPPTPFGQRPGDAYAPNAAEAQARSVRSTFSGRLDIAGAPPGSKVSSDSGGITMFDLNLLGANP